MNERRGCDGVIRAIAPGGTLRRFAELFVDERVELLVAGIALGARLRSQDQERPGRFRLPLLVRGMVQVGSSPESASQAWSVPETGGRDPSEWERSRTAAVAYTPSSI